MARKTVQTLLFLGGVLCVWSAATITEDIDVHPRLLDTQDDDTHAFGEEWQGMIMNKLKRDLLPAEQDIDEQDEHDFKRTFPDFSVKRIHSEHGMRERERERETKGKEMREREREREREEEGRRERERERMRERFRNGQKERERERERERQRKTGYGMEDEKERERQRERDGDHGRERERQRERMRARQGKNEREREREEERQRQREGAHGIEEERARRKQRQRQRKILVKGKTILETEGEEKGEIMRKVPGLGIKKERFRSRERSEKEE